MADKDFRKYLRMNTSAAIPILLFYLNKNKNFVFTLFLYCTSRNYLSKNSLQLMLVFVFASWNSENKRTCSAQVRLYCVSLKKIISVQCIKSNWFGLKFSKYFCHVILENIFRIFNNSVYFQNIVVCNEN